MSEFLFHYHKVHPATWAYLSSLLVVALFFIFSRFWRVRNLDLVLLILLAPGLLLVTYGRESQHKAAQLVVQASALEIASKTPTDDGGQDKDSDADTSATQPQPTTSATSTEDDASSEPKPDSADAAQPESTIPPDATNSDSSTEPGVAEPDADKLAEQAQVAALMVEATNLDDRGRWLEKLGFFFLLGMCGVMLIRLLLDPTMVRRPLLEPNLGTGGMVFMGCALFIFLMANVITSETTVDDVRGAMGAHRMLAGATGSASGANDSSDLERHGPGYALLSLLPSISTATILQTPTSEDSQHDAFEIAAKAMALLSHLAVVLGMIGIGYWHFENVKMGVGAALLYLLLPYTSIMTGRVDHVLPAALLVWAVLCYRRPLAAGIFIGLAAGVVYYPLFVLPLWFSFYRQRGVWRFTAGLLATLVVMTLSLALISDSLDMFFRHVQAMFGLWLPKRGGVEGVWGVSWDPVYRLPVLAAFVVLSCTLAMWPARKNLGTLLSCSAALMIATQFWHGFGGGLYMGWFLPLTLLTMFRPNLEDRVALSVLGESWLVRRRPRLARVGEAA